MTDSIARLRQAGVSVWLDDLSRERLATSSLAALRDRGVSGVTTNPTIFARAISDSDAYDGSPGFSRSVRRATHRLGSTNGSSRSAVTGARIRASAPRISPRCSEQMTSW